MDSQDKNITLYNSLTRKKERFEPLKTGFVGIYVCGPTVYGHSHLGHAKSYISFDIVVRWFRYLGYKVRYVQNITDVGHLTDDADAGEDKIQEQAKLEQLEPMEIAEFYATSYFEDMDRLNNLRPNISPRASGHIVEQIEAIRELVDLGFAYERNGNVYFSVAKFPEYGKLSGKKLDDLEAGKRITIAMEKENPADFALWKKADPSHIMRWPSPWGEGYPGWHLECSVMSNKYLGKTFDIHGGGLENIFPHHECEIAQAEAANKDTFARYWMHNNMVTVDGVKMGKSLGNFTTLKEAFSDYEPMVIRLFILQSHYRSPLDFSREALAATEKGWHRILASVATIKVLPVAPEGLDEWPALAQFKASLTIAMNDDFNTPRALAATFDFIRAINDLKTSGAALQSSLLQEAQTFYMDVLADVFGFALASENKGVEKEILDKLVRSLIDERKAMRASKNFQRADEIREHLASLGIILKDTPQDTEWSIQSSE